MTTSTASSDWQRRALAWQEGILAQNPYEMGVPLGRAVNDADEGLQRPVVIKKEELPIIIKDEPQDEQLPAVTEDEQRLREERRRRQEQQRKRRLRRQKKKAARVPKLRALVGFEEAARRKTSRVKKARKNNPTSPRQITPVEETAHEDEQKHAPTDPSRTTDIYTSGSSINNFGGSGFAFFHLSSNRFLGCATSLGPSTPPSAASEWAVRLSLQFARQRLIGSINLLRLHIDCQTTLRAVQRILQGAEIPLGDVAAKVIRRNIAKTDVMGEAVDEICMLRKAGVRVEVRGYSRNEGNENADQLAKMGAMASREQGKGLGEWVEWKEF